MWIERPLAELASITSGGTPARDVAGYWGGEIPWVTPSDITACTTNVLRETKERITSAGLAASAARMVPAESILLTSRATVGEARMAGMPLCTNQGFKALTARPGIDPWFLFYQVQRCRGQFERFAAGSTFLEIGKRDTERVRLGHPIDIASQKRIAAILTSLDTAIEATEALIEKHRQIRDGLMQSLITQGVDAAGHLRDGPDVSPSLYRESTYGPIPVGWTVGSLVEKVGPAGCVNGPFGSDLLSTELRKEGVPVLYVQDVKAGAFRRVSSACVSPTKAAQLAFCSVRQGDVLVAKVGSPPCDACVYPFEERAIVTQDVIRVRPTPDVAATFLAALLNSPIGRRAVRKIAIEGTRERVSLTEFKALLFPWPSREEQDAIGARLQSIQDLIDSETLSVGKLRSEKQGLTHDLLTGKVSVRVD